MSEANPLVVKVGGSLLVWPGLRTRLTEFLRDERAGVVLVAGGGVVADAVRVLDEAQAIGEARSHALALRALDLTARVLAGLVDGLVVVERPDDLERVWRQGRTPALAPRWFMENIDAHSPDPLPETWETTSDSIAARLAEYLGGAGLVLLKSAPFERFRDREEAARGGYVDPVFPRASAGLRRVEVFDFRGNVRTKLIANRVVR